MSGSRQITRKRRNRSDKKHGHNFFGVAVLQQALMASDRRPFNTFPFLLSLGNPLGYVLDPPSGPPLQYTPKPGGIFRAQTWVESIGGGGSRIGAYSQEASGFKVQARSPRP